MEDASELLLLLALDRELANADSLDFGFDKPASVGIRGCCSNCES
jgi:hypothetical protein